MTPRLLSLSIFCTVSLALVIASCTRELNPEGPDPTPPRIVLPVEGQSVGQGTAIVVVKISSETAVKTLDLFLDNASTPIATLTQAPWVFELNTTALSEGPHTLTAKMTPSAGVVLFSDPRKIVRTDDTNLRDERMLLVENFTNTGCMPCKAAEEAYEQILANKALESRVATVLYHVFWPDPKDPFYLANPQPVQTRVAYDSVKSAPHARFNGWLRNENTLNFFEDWQEQMLTELSRPAEVGIALTKAVNGDNVTIEARLTPYADVYPNDLRFHVIVTEDSLFYEGSNGIKIHNFVMRSMVTGNNGKAITLAKGQPQTLTESFTISSKWTRTQLHLVAFIQSFASRMAFQAAKLKVE